MLDRNANIFIFAAAKFAFSQGPARSIAQPAKLSSEVSTFERENFADPLISPSNKRFLIIKSICPFAATTSKEGRRYKDRRACHLAAFPSTTCQDEGTVFALMVSHAIRLVIAQIHLPFYLTISVLYIHLAGRSRPCSDACQLDR